MQSIRSRRSHWRIWLSASITLVIICGVVAIFWSNQTGAPQSDNKTAVVKPAVQPKTISSNVLFLGNTYWGRYINDWSMASPLKYQYPFSRLGEFHRDQYDAWISGIECPLVAGVNLTSAEEDSTLTFNCNPKYLPEAAKWFTAFTLANNHTDNQGVDGFTETKQQLDKVGIQYYGHYDPRSLDDICEVIALPVTVQNDDKSVTKGNLPVAMCGYHGVFRLPTPEAVAQMAKYAKYMPVIAAPHMGVEYKTTPDQLKIDFYRSLIDGGADMVIGDHPHWIQPSESYKGHLIVYSMGNFMFDQQDQPDVVRSAGIRVVIKTGITDPAMLKKWLALGDTCKLFKDDCLTQATQQRLTKIDISYKFGVVGTNDGDKITKPATPDQQASILDRLNWQTTIKNLQPPYSSL